MPKDLAERFTVSVVPVREALRRLEAEGLVVTSPQRATFAAEVGLEDLAGVYDFRRIVEVELAGRAAKIATTEDRARCRSALDDLMAAEPHSVAFFETHRTFHWRLLEPAASVVAQRILERLWQSVDRYMALAVKMSPEVSSSEYIAKFNTEHRALAAAFEAGDDTLLRELLDTHLSDTEVSLRRAYEDLAPTAPMKS
jgi:DNA-binding GntR family transcriptional regulator